MDQDNSAFLGVDLASKSDMAGFSLILIEQEKPNELDVFAATIHLVEKSILSLGVKSSELPAFIGEVHKAVEALAFATGGEQPAAAPVEPPVPAVPIKKSVTPDYLISLEDGKRYKSLKRHLGGRGLTPQQYRQKWGLPEDYPMVAANYAARRSELAKASGLGQRRKAA